MTTKQIFQGLGVLILASATWRYVRSDVVQSWLHPESHKAAAIKFQNDGPAADAAPSSASAAPRNIPMAVSGAHKCRKGNTVIYTDRDCPTGAREQDISGGAITVVQGHLNSHSATPAHPLPTARDLLGSSGEGSLMDKRIEQVTNR